MNPENDTNSQRPETEDPAGPSSQPYVAPVAISPSADNPNELAEGPTQPAEELPVVTATANGSDFDFDKFFITAEDFLSHKPISVAQDDKTPAPKPIVQKNSDNTGTITHDKYKITLGKDAKENATISVESPKDSLNELLLLFKIMAQERNDADGKIIFEITDPKHLTQEKLESLLEKIDYGDLKDRIEIRVPMAPQSTNETNQKAEPAAAPTLETQNSSADSADPVSVGENVTRPELTATPLKDESRSTETITRSDETAGDVTDPTVIRSANPADETTSSTDSPGTSNHSGVELKHSWRNNPRNDQLTAEGVKQDDSAQASTPVTPTRTGTSEGDTNNTVTVTLSPGTTIRL